MIKKKGQISMLIIIGIIIISVFLFLSYSNKNEIEKLNQINQADLVLVKFYMESCIEATVSEAIIELKTLNSSKLENYTNNHIKNCTDGFSTFSEFEISEGDMTSDFLITNYNNSLILDIDYPLRIKTKESVSSLSHFNLDFNLDKKNDFLENGVTLKEIELTSLDKSAVLTIPEGVTILNSDNTPAKFISINIKEIGNYKGDFVGEIIYELEPHGAQLSEAVELTIKYDEEDIPIHNDSSLDAEDFLTISTFDSGFDPKLAKPQNSTINKSENTVTAKITHFSDWVVESESRNQDFMWSSFLSRPGGMYYSSYSFTHWPSAFYFKYGIRYENAHPIVDGEVYYGGLLIDRGEGRTSGSARLVYGEKTRPTTQYPKNLDVVLYKNNKPFAKTTISDPTRDEQLVDIHRLTCLSTECGYKGPSTCTQKDSTGDKCSDGTVNCDGLGGCDSYTSCAECPYVPSSDSSSSSSGTCNAIGRPGSPENACKINMDTNQPCPAGTVNCDCEGGCAWQGTEATCPVECPEGNNNNNNNNNNNDLTPSSYSCERIITYVHIFAGQYCDEDYVHEKVDYTGFSEPYGLSCVGGGNGFLLSTSLGQAWRDHKPESACTADFDPDSDSRIVAKIPCDGSFYEFSKSDLSGKAFGVLGTGADSYIRICSGTASSLCTKKTESGVGCKGTVNCDGLGGCDSYTSCVECP